MKIKTISSHFYLDPLMNCNVNFFSDSGKPAPPFRSVLSSQITVMSVGAIILVMMILAIPPAHAADTDRQAEYLWKYPIPEEIYEIALSADGQYLAVGTEMDKVYYFNRDGKLLWTFSTNLSYTNIAPSSDGQFVAVASKDNLYLFNRDGKILWRKPTEPLRTVSISANGQYVVAGSYKGTVYFFGPNGHLLWSYVDKNVQKPIIINVRISADGKYMTARTDDNEYPWDKERICYFNNKGILLWSEKQTGWAGMMGTDVSADGKYVVTGTQNHKISFFDRDGDILWTYTANEWVRDVALSKDNWNIAAGSSDGNIYYLNREGKLLWSFNIGRDVFSLALSSNGDYVIASGGGKIYFLNRNGQPVWNYPNLSAADVAVSGDGRYIAVGAFDNFVYFFNREGTKPDSIVTMNTPEVKGVTCSEPIVAVNQPVWIQFFKWVSGFFKENDQPSSFPVCTEEDPDNPTPQDPQPVSNGIPHEVLSPVVGKIGFTNCCGDGCYDQRVIDKWEFCQHQSGYYDSNNKFNEKAKLGHVMNGGVGYATDTYAWDINKNLAGKPDADKGEPVYAIAPGKVALHYGQVADHRIVDTDFIRLCTDPSQFYDSGGNLPSGDFGQVLIEHDNGKWYSGYVHLTDIKVKNGQTDISTGTLLGYISNKGVPGGNNHLHFAIYTGENTACGLKSIDVKIKERVENP